MTPLIDALNVRAISAYEREDASALPGLRSLGAALALQGIADNGGLVAAVLSGRSHPPVPRTGAGLAGSSPGRP